MSGQTASKHTLAYWAFTGGAAALLAAGGVADLSRSQDVLEVLDRLGYPHYLATILGVAKLLGAAGILIPRVPRWLREWAYAGIVFDLVGAALSHLAVDDPIGDALMPLGFLALTLISYVLWKTRPAVSA